MHIVTPSCQQRNGPRVIAVTLTPYYTQRPVEMRLLLLQERHFSHVNTKNHNARRYSGTTLRPKNGSLAQPTPFQFPRLPVRILVSVLRDLLQEEHLIDQYPHDSRPTSISRHWTSFQPVRQTRWALHLGIPDKCRQDQVALTFLYRNHFLTVRPSN